MGNNSTAIFIIWMVIVCAISSCASSKSRVMKDCKLIDENKYKVYMCEEL